MAETCVGAEAFIEQLIAADVEWLFGNPGTNEQPVLGRLGAYPQIGYILALHEAVAVGAAEGYARASGKVGVVQLHAGPGLGNGLGMLHNARAGGTPLLVYVGQAEQRGAYLEPTLGADLVGEAATVSKWAYEIRTADEIPQIVRRAFKVAQAPPRGPVVLSVPMDLMERACSAPIVAPSYVRSAVRPDPDAIEDAAGRLLDARAPVILVGDGVAAAHATAEVGALARLLGAPIHGAFTSEVCVAPDEPLDAGRLPSIEGSAAARALEPYDLVLAIGTKLFSHVFPVPGLPLGERELIHIGLDPWELGKNQPGLLILGDEAASIRELVASLERRLGPEARAEAAARGATAARAIAERRRRALAADRDHWSDRPMSTERAVAEVAAAMPDGGRLVDELLTGYAAVSRYFKLGPEQWFRLRGGGIGEGMPMPLGVKLADPSRPVLAIVGDGSALYTISSLWTAAHHRLPVVWVILDNRAYRTLKENTRRDHAGAPAPHLVGADLDDPELDFVAIAAGMGVQARRIADPDEVGPAVRAAVESDRPTLLDLTISGS